MVDTLTIEELENEHVEELPSMDMMGGRCGGGGLFIGIGVVIVVYSDANLKRDIRAI